MPEHHHKDVTHFGEDYYDEVREEQEINDELEENDPYAQADRMNREAHNVPVNQHPKFTDTFGKEITVLGDQTHTKH